MSGLLAAEAVAILAHLVDDVAIANARAANINSPTSYRPLESYVAHHRCHQGVLLERVALNHCPGADRHRRISIDDLSRLVDDDQPVRVPVDRDPHVRI